jgi:hypothetical protein
MKIRDTGNIGHRRYRMKMNKMQKHNTTLKTNKMSNKNPTLGGNLRCKR